MKFDLKEFIEKAKAAWAKLSDKAKKIIIFGGSALLVLIILITVLLNVSKGDYRVLFPGMSDEESAQVYATLQEMNVQPQLDT